MSVIEVKNRNITSMPPVPGQVRTNLNGEVVIISGCKNAIYYTYLKSPEGQDFKTYSSTVEDIEEYFPKVIKAEIILE